MTETLCETLGVDGVVSGGAEYQTVSEAGGATTTETDHPTETMTDSVSEVTSTVAETNTNTDTDNESDQDWATETLGASATISGGSDCFTVNDLDASSSTLGGSGPENASDTSNPLSGTQTLSGSGSSSSLVHQTFGDALGSGGPIASGSLSYTDTTSEADAPTQTETGTETVTDDESGGPSQTASYTIISATPVNNTAWETGTETLGGGGAIASSSSSFSWHDGSAINRSLTINGLTYDGITTDLFSNESSTDTYGFGESGTESITTGGADVPGNIQFVWNQLGTDNDALTQGNTSAPWAYDLTLTDTVSSTWNDTGSDILTTGDSLAGVTDTYTWNDFHDLTDGVLDTSTELGNTMTQSGGGEESFHIWDTGADSLTLTGTIGTYSLVTGTDCYTIEDSITDDSGLDNSISNATSSLNVAEEGTDYFDLYETGWDSQSTTLDEAGNAYALDQGVAYSRDWNSWSEGDGGSTVQYDGAWFSYGIEAGGTSSDGLDGAAQSTLTYSNVSVSTQTFNLAASGTVPSTYTDTYNYYTSQSSTETGNCTENDGNNAFDDVSIDSVSSSEDDIGIWTMPVSDGETVGVVTSWEASGTYSSGDSTAWEMGDDGSGLSGGSTPGVSSSASYSYGLVGSPEPAVEYQLDAYEASQSGPGNALGGSLLNTLLTNEGWSSPADISVQPYSYDRIVPDLAGAPTDYVVSLWDDRTEEGYAPPLTVIVYRGGTVLIGGTSGTGFNAAGILNDGTAGPDTDSATVNGMPWQEEAKLGSFVENIGSSDEVSRGGPLPPETTLTALAAPGRNPADITIPTLTGSEGSGGDDDVEGGGGDAEPMDDVPVGTHEGPLNDSDIGALRALNIDEDWIQQAVDEEIPTRVVFAAVARMYNRSPRPTPRPAPNPNAGIAQAADVLEATGKGGVIAGKQAVLGEFAEEQNALGTVFEIFVGFTPLDTAADIRDAAAAALEVQRNPDDPVARRKLAIYLVSAVVPLVGGRLVLKLVGEGAEEGAEQGAKFGVKHGDDVVPPAGTVAPKGFRPNSVPVPQGYTRAYRAVSEAEYQDILATGKLQQGPNSLEGKWFADSIEGAQAHGKSLYPDGNFRLVEVDIPNNAPSLSTRPNLDRLGPARYIHNDDLPTLAPRPLE